MLTPELITELQEILRNDFHEEYTREETLVIARALLNFFEFLTSETRK